MNDAKLMRCQAPRLEAGYAVPCHPARPAAHLSGSALWTGRCQHLRAIVALPRDRIRACIQGDATTSLAIAVGPPSR